VYRETYIVPTTFLTRLFYGFELCLVDIEDNAVGLDEVIRWVLNLDPATIPDARIE
jgi:hypothetical protein